MGFDLEQSWTYWVSNLSDLGPMGVELEQSCVREGWQKYVFMSIHRCKVPDFATWGSSRLPPLPHPHSPQISGSEVPQQDSRPASDKIQISSVIINYELLNDLEYASVIDIHSNTPLGSAFCFLFTCIWMHGLAILQSI